MFFLILSHVLKLITIIESEGFLNMLGWFGGAGFYTI